MWTQIKICRQLYVSAFGQHQHQTRLAHQWLDKILVANRGEIACRVIRTAKRLGIKTVAVYSDADRHSMHTEMADECYRIGRAVSSDSYLSKEKVIEAAIRSESDAIHPGYGFLSENYEFAELCAQNRITFIGPPATAIRDMGIKSTSKAIMMSAGVPVIPGYHGDNQDDRHLLDEARRIGFPVMIKAVRGGGGKGMRIAANESEFVAQLESARREATKAFGDDVMLIEKLVANPRHIEVQIFGDQHNNYVHLFERDCSAQRRHQKVIEEAPAPGISWSVRDELGSAAVTAAAAVGYVGAGTVEFIYDSIDQKFYFMEMNTRLQVEHPVTEMITGLDLVEWQIRVAAGQPLPLKQADLKLNGHSIEGRIYAEDPDNNFMPGAGHVVHARLPTPAADVRIETGVRIEDEVSVHYDPMIAKLVVWAPDRHRAIKKFRQSLSQYNIVGLKTNVDFLLKLSAHPEFTAGNIYTNFIADFRQQLFSAKHITDPILCAATLAVTHEDLINETCRNKGQPYSLFNELDGKRFNGLPFRRYVNLVNTDEEKQNFSVKVGQTGPQSYSIQIADKFYENVVYTVDESNVATVEIGDVRHKYGVFIYENSVAVFTDNESFSFELKMPEYLKSVSDGADSLSQSVTAPMPGIIDKILVENGQSVRAGDSVIVMIAMKMEYVIKANRDSVVEAILYKTGDSVPKGSQLIRFKHD